MTQQTPLNAIHRELGARMVDFGGWEMPINYGSQIEEHHQVRRDAGMFDVSHMTVVDLTGEHCRSFLRHLLANDVAKLRVPGKALYTCMLRENGGIIDDLIVYYLAEDFFRLVVNAATRDKDLVWIEGQAHGFGVAVRERRDLAMIAVQGPNARARVLDLIEDAPSRERIGKLGRFAASACGDLFIARTGYTGEDGFEVMLPTTLAEDFWRNLLAKGVKPTGLGARDTLRLEAGMNLYGQDMDETTTPLESGLAWTVAFDPDDREFVGRATLEQQRSHGISRELVGLVMDDKGVLRHGQRVISVAGEGEITSGSFSPTLGKAIALARIPVNAGNHIKVDIRGREVPVYRIRPPFVKNGEAAPKIQ